MNNRKTLLFVIFTSFSIEVSSADKPIYSEARVSLDIRCFLLSDLDYPIGGKQFSIVAKAFEEEVLARKKPVAYGVLSRSEFEGKVWKEAPLFEHQCIVEQSELKVEWPERSDWSIVMRPLVLADDSTIDFPIFAREKAFEPDKRFEVVQSPVEKPIDFIQPLLTLEDRQALLLIIPHRSDSEMNLAVVIQAMIVPEH